MNAVSQGPSRHTERAQAQRERILCAAQKCFIEHGFHAAGMALIAETAEMSPGLIYRYFDSKNAIILAIVGRQLEDARTCIRALHDAPDMTAAALDTFNCWRNGDPRMMNAALFLEMTAEASRNPELVAAFADSDQAVRCELANWLSADVASGGKGLPPEVARLRAISLQCYFVGLAIRALREPDISQSDLQAAIGQFMQGLYSTVE
ncbi:TetR/AcrR family transcriptional regulator [Janthinobacterium sp. 17J80-10]|uniref:TetR/AcrR family transcriptional regulator n=1 Tax=Janthinobacterium sp. 17J80-10 TaxID=2497863 RepID=UPI00100596BF|nr:TetR/AcrR family transcriptional regulator [Janthinobacterium sp. 17J80-10]QAU34461.1 TetR/AcrR family transcriptional regulator [Janthinobacterium sp. 17J80-10]